jgi:phosphopentomutase
MSNETGTIDRVIVIVLDSAGIGELPDAAEYGDEGSNTIGNIARQVGLRVPTLRSLGLARLVDIGAPAPAPLGACARMAEASAGKDSVTGHWEIAGIVLDHPFPTFPHGFPAAMIEEFERRAGRRTIGNVAASGTAIIETLGPDHLRTGAPIVYTSADSVFQLAAHETVIPPRELYRLCDIAFDIAVRRAGMGRVIARPFVGEPGRFVRTANRRDFAATPPRPTLLDRVKGAGLPVVGIGKIGDLFAGQGLTADRHTSSDAHGLELLESELSATRRGFILANLVDFDTAYGHRNDVAGYAANLERVDARLAEMLPRLASGDLLIVTADHGNDPTTPSTDHSREYVPVLAAGAMVRPGTECGTRPTFADLGQTIAAALGVPALDVGTSFLTDILR